VIDAGEIHLADLNEELRRRVLVVSTARFTEFSGRVVIVPEARRVPDTVSYPWRVAYDDVVFAVDHVRSIPAARLLEPVGRASNSVMVQIQHALRQIV
jgi:mRNA-degrading endonuclease toxin of MazEF toxin-antitoxin module